MYSRISLGSDHAGFELKQYIKEYLESITEHKLGKDIRCALCWNSEITEMARLHNDANILSLPGRYISKEEAIKCIDAFLNTEFEGGRHADRIAKIKIKNV